MVGVGFNSGWRDIRSASRFVPAKAPHAAFMNCPVDTVKQKKTPTL